jgi:hypothetical protein
MDHGPSLDFIARSIFLLQSDHVANAQAITLQCLLKQLLRNRVAKANSFASWRFGLPQQIADAFRNVAA